MAKVIISRTEAKDDLLPDVCMKCGEPATTRVKKQFSWHPPWVAVLILVGLLPYVIVALALTKKMTIHAPLCNAHRRHWSVRSLFIVGGLLALLLGMFVLLGITSDPQNRGDQDLSGIYWLGFVGLALLWLVTAAILQTTSIRPEEITDRELTLVGVSKDFRDALEDDRDREEARYRDEDEDDYDDRPRKNRPFPR